MAMPRPRWPHLLREVSRHGTVRWVVRIGHGPRIALGGGYGTKEFEAAYHAAIENLERDTGTAQRARNSMGTLSWLVARYQASSEWGSFSKATQKKRACFYKNTLDTAGEMPYAEITPRHIRDGMETRKATPSQANNWRDAMSKLFAWAVENEFIPTNPTEGVRRVRERKTGGFVAWTEADINAFEQRWSVGRRERLAFALLFHTGLRRGDIARLGRQQIRASSFYLRTEKTGAAVTIPIHPELQRCMDATRIGFTFIAAENGRPLTKEAFGRWFGKACREAGVKASPCHGLRKFAAANLVNAGVSEAELDAIMGWSPGSGMSRVYTRGRDTERLARQAANKLATSYSQPNSKVGNEN